VVVIEFPLPKPRFSGTPAGVILFILFAWLAFLPATANGGLPAGPRKDPATPKIYKAGYGVTAPVVIDSPQPAFTHDESGPKLQGVVNVAIMIAANGTVNSAEAQGSPDQRLAEAAVNIVKKWKFKPATKHGVPVWCRVLVVITFHSK